MAESGKVVSVENGIACVELPRKPVCGKCGLCMMSGTAPVMLMQAYAPNGVTPEERVTVVVDRSLRWRAQLWLLAVPLVTFIGSAIVAKIVLGWGDGFTALAAFGGMAASFGMVMLADTWRGWSIKPVAWVTTEADESGDNAGNL